MVGRRGTGDVMLGENVAMVLKWAQISQAGRAPRCLWFRAVGVSAIESPVVSTGSGRVLWIVLGLSHNAEDECDVGAKLVALVINVPCSAVPVVPVCVHLCGQVPCGEVLETVMARKDRGPWLW